MLDYRSTVAAAVCAGAALVGCSDPDLPTDLRTSGPPNVTTVLIGSDLTSTVDPNPGGFSRLLETATFCRLNDNKRPKTVSLPDIRSITVCPVDLSKPAEENGTAEGAPPGWYVRIAFDKLLDPRIEDLVPVLDSMGNQTGTIGTFRGPNMTQPVTLKCNGVDIAYDGYYAPGGNGVSWPVGPDLFIAPLRPTDAPTGATCTVSIRDNVHNKAGESVPADQRDYTFKIAPMALRFAVPDPAEADDGSITQDPTTSLEFFFTAALKANGTLGTGADTLTLTTLDPNTVTIKAGPNLNISGTNPDGDPNPAVCMGGGTPVPAANIRSFIRGTGAASTALVMELDAGGPTATPTDDLVWEPSTTYLVTFNNASVAPSQGGASATLPGDFKLCFHTTAAPM